MSLFSVLPGVLSLFGGASQYRQGTDLVNSGQNDYNTAINTAGSAYRNALALMQQRQAQGAYDASAALRLAGDQAAHDLTLNDQNTAGQLANLGYKPGDSPFQQTAAHNSESANLALRQQLLAAQDAYQQKYNRDLTMANGLGGQYSNVLQNIGGRNIQMGQQMQQSAFSGLGSLIGGDFLNAGSAPNPSPDPYAQAGSDTNPTHSYNQFGQLIGPNGLPVSPGQIFPKGWK